MRQLANSKFICFVCGILLALFASLALSLLIPQKAYAQAINDLSTLNLEGASKQAMPNDAVREVADELTLSTARSQVIQSIGDASYQKNKSMIEDRILKNTSRFIPSVNPGAPLKQKDGSWKVPVQLRLSNASLKKVLMENGLVAASSGAASVLPLIAVIDRAKSTALRWWMGENRSAEQKSLIPLINLLHQKLAEEFQKQSVVFTKPSQERIVSLPETLKLERPASAELTAIGNYFKSSMIAKGDVRILPSPAAGIGSVQIKIQVLQTNAPDRIIAEVARDFTSDPHAPSVEAGLRTRALVEFASLAKDLAAQVQIALQRGAAGTNFLSLAVRGPLSPLQQSAFKNAFVQSVHEARDVKERLYERGQVTYEVDFSGDATQFANRIKSLRLPGFQMQVPEGQAGARLLTVDIRSTEASSNNEP